MSKHEDWKEVCIENLKKLSAIEKEKLKKANPVKNVNENKSTWPFANDYFDSVWSKEDESNN